MPYLFNICRYRIIVLAQLSKNARVIRVWLDVCVLQLVVSRKYLAHLYSKLFFTPRIPVQRSSLLSPSEAPLRSSNKIGLRAVSSSRGERLIACKTFMSCGYWRTLTRRFRLRVHLLSALG